MLRAAVAAGTPVGLKAKEIMDRGELVPTTSSSAIVADRIDEPDAKNGFILDGFPRTVAQAEALDRMLREQGPELDAVIELKVDEGALIRRIENRGSRRRWRAASRCARTTIRRCSRPGSTPTGARPRPLIDYYREKGLLRTVDGMAPIDEVDGGDRLDLRAKRGSESQQALEATGQGQEVAKAVQEGRSAQGQAGRDGGRRRTEGQETRCRQKPQERQKDRQARRAGRR